MKGDLIIRFVMFAKDGRVIVLIKGVRYEYITPAYHHDRWRRRARRAPGKVLAEVKEVASEYERLT